MWVPRHHRGALGLEAFDEREKRAVIVKAIRLSGHSLTNRMRRVDLDPDDRPRSEMLVAGQASLEIADGYREFINDQIATGPHGDQRAARANEVAQLGQSFFANPAAVFWANGLEVEAVKNIARLLVGQQDDVKPGCEPTLDDVGVVQ